MIQLDQWRHSNSFQYILADLWSLLTERTKKLLLASTSFGVCFVRKRQRNYYENIKSKPPADLFTLNQWQLIRRLQIYNAFGPLDYAPSTLSVIASLSLYVQHYFVSDSRSSIRLTMVSWCAASLAAQLLTLSKCTSKVGQVE